MASLRLDHRVEQMGLGVRDDEFCKYLLRISQRDVDRDKKT